MTPEGTPMKLPRFPQRQVNGTVEVVSAEECQASGKLWLLKLMITFHTYGFVDWNDDNDLVKRIEQMSHMNL
jgi:hypothetical protein